MVEPNQQSLSSPAKPLEKLATELFEVYSTRDKQKQATLVQQLYADNAVFSDNITYVQTAKEIEIMFRGLSAMFPTVAVEVFSVEPMDGPEGKQVTIKNCQTYGCTGLMARMAGSEVKIPVTTTLTINEEGRIVMHQDSWQDKGSAPRFLRSAGGKFTNFLLRCTGSAKLP